MTPDLQPRPDTLGPAAEEPAYAYARDEFIDMAAVVTALYDQVNDARRAVEELIGAGFQREQVSVVAAEPTAGTAAAAGIKEQQETGLDAGRGALIGGLGGLLVGMVALVLPAIGPVMAAGPLAIALVGAGAGTITGGLVGALIEFGLDQEEAEQYSEGVRRGGILVTVQTHDSMIDRVVDVMDSHNPVDVRKRAQDWYRAGWNGFNHKQ